MIGMGGGATGLAQAGGATALEATGGLINEYTTPTGNFRTHIFTASGALTISAGKLEAFDYWVVAAGGGGGTVDNLNPIMSLNRGGANDGGVGNAQTDGQSAQCNSGAGGGGGGGPNQPDPGTMGGMGGPGVVMIRYALADAAGSAPTTCSGGVISYTPTHTIHSFMYPGVFQLGPTFSKTVEYVIVGGGGGGGRG